MPVTFTVMAGGTPVVFSTDLCGTCEHFIHRSYLAGDCEENYKPGEISVSDRRCVNWKLKEFYREPIEREINKVKRNDEIS